MVAMIGEFKKVAARKGGGYVVSLRSDKSLNDSELLGKPGTQTYREQVGYFIERPIYISLSHDINGHKMPTVAQSFAMLVLGVSGRPIPKSLKWEEPEQNKRWDVMSQEDIAKNLVSVKAPGNTRALEVYVPNMKKPPKGYKEAPVSHFPGHKALFS